jgi:IS1 family transposase
MRERLRIMASMKKLDQKTRVQVLHLLMEGNSIRGVTRITGVSKTTILKLIEDAGRAAAWYQDRVFQNLKSKRLQVDELWGFVHAKQKNVPRAKKAPVGAGDCWLWVATDADTKLVPSWYVGGRDSDAAIVLMDDLASRLANRVQLTTDGHKAYLEAVEGAFGSDIDYAMLVKLYGESPESEKRYSPAVCIGARKTRIEGEPDPKHVSTSYAERNNLNVRMHSRRLTRLTNAFSKKVANHAHAMALHFLYYNFVRIHQTLKVSPAMAAGISDRLWEMKDVAEMLEAWETAQLRQT